MSVRMLAPKGGGFGGSPISIGGRNKCQRGLWAPNVSHVGLLNYINIFEFLIFFLSFSEYFREKSVKLITNFINLILSFFI